MEKQGITPVQVIQELTAMLSTRKEACEKILGKADAASFSGEIKSYVSQTDGYIAQLQSELSEFGDAVMSDVDRNNAYQDKWKQALQTADNTSAGELKEVFMQMEQTLAISYASFADTAGNLPESLSGILVNQAEGLSRP